MKRFLLSAALLAAATSAIQAHTLDGIVKDNKTGEPLIGTVIRVKELPNVSTTTGLDGTVFCSPADGFSVFTVDKKQLRMSMIDKDGKIIHTVLKSK